MPTSDAPAAAPPAGPVQVELHRRVVHIAIQNFAFVPARVEVSPGTKVIWTNDDPDPHTVDSTPNICTSDTLDTGQSFTRTFTQAGRFAYYDSINPFMHGVLVVKRPRRRPS